MSINLEKLTPEDRERLLAEAEARVKTSELSLGGAVDKLLNGGFLKGKKTYIVAALTFLAAIADYLTGSISLMQLATEIMASIEEWGVPASAALVALRMGIRTDTKDARADVAQMQEQVDGLRTLVANMRAANDQGPRP